MEQIAIWCSKAVADRVGGECMCVYTVSRVIGPILQDWPDTNHSHRFINYLKASEDRERTKIVVECPSDGLLLQELMRVSRENMFEFSLGYWTVGV
jgi:hypothetical protein